MAAPDPYNPQFAKKALPNGVNPGVGFANSPIANFGRGVLGFDANIIDGGRNLVNSAANAIGGAFGGDQYPATHDAANWVASRYPAPTGVNPGAMMGSTGGPPAAPPVAAPVATPAGVNPGALVSDAPTLAAQINAVNGAGAPAAAPAAANTPPNIPLPAGVRALPDKYNLHGMAGMPGGWTPSARIFEGVGAHGERSFSNNPYVGTLRGIDHSVDGAAYLHEAPDPQAGNAAAYQKSLDATAAQQTYNAMQRGLAYAAAPKNATEAAATTTANANAALTGAKTAQTTEATQAAVAQHLQQVKDAANQGAINDRWNKTKAALIAGGMTEPAAAANVAQQITASGGDPTKTDAGTAGDYAMRAQIAAALNSHLNAYGFGQTFSNTGQVDDPATTPATAYNLERIPGSMGSSARLLVGPKAKDGSQRRSIVSDPGIINYIQQQQANAMARRTPQLISDQQP